MAKGISWGVMGLSVYMSACGGSATTGGADSPADEEMPDGMTEETELDVMEEEPVEEEPSSEEGAAAEPEFTPGMSVEEAQNAVPASVERLNIEEEALAQPLNQPELYEPCALQGHHHFKVKVAVYDGRAVGLDLETTPADDKIAACIRQQIQGVKWRDKAKSINTVEYSY